MKSDSSVVSFPQSASARQRAIELKGTCDALRGLPSGLSDSVEEALCRYVVIRSVGFIEAVRDDAASRYAEAVGHQRLKRRIAIHLYKGTGATPSQLLDFAGSFDPLWRERLDEFFNENDARVKSNLGAMVAARKKIAHGDGENVTVGRALGWSDTAFRVANFLDALFV